MLLMISGFDGDDEPNDERELLTDGGDLMDDGDDLMGGGGDGLMDDDVMSGDQGGNSGEDDLNYRLDEVEKEIESLENQVDTVRGENEQISETVTSVERNVDKLVDLYEMVTQGVNPFVGDQEIGNAFESATEQGGVFGTGGDSGDESEVDEEIAGAEAEAFLDDDIADDDDAGFDDEFADEPAGDEDVDDEVADTAGWDAEIDDEMADETDDQMNDEPDGGVGDGAEPLEVADGDETDTESDQQLSATTTRGENGEVGDPPYLVRQPSRNDAELITIEWLDFLVDAAGIEGAAQTLAYYESVGWLSAPVTAHLQSMLNGFGDGSRVTPADADPQSVLSTAEHKRSLQYIAWIATPESAPDLLSVDGETPTVQ